MDPGLTEADELLALRLMLAQTVSYASAHPDFLLASRREPSRLPGREAKEVRWLLWQRILDCSLALDRSADACAGWSNMAGPQAGETFIRFSSAFFSQYRFALDFIALAERDPLNDSILNDAVPEVGLPAGTYDAFKFRFLNAARGAEFALLHAALKIFAGAAQPAISAAIEEDAAALWAHGVGEGPVLTAKNALAILGKTALRAWFPVQKRTSLALSHLRLPVREGWHISPEETRAIAKRLAPGDILLQRREWAFTNLGLPGFWTHAALYLGTPEERGAAFDDRSVARWLRERQCHSGDLDTLLADSFPEAFAKLSLPCEDGDRPTVIEALAPGVILRSLARSCSCDGLAVLRPRLPLASKASALLWGLHFFGRPYDFNFDFATDSAMVCSELVLKAYQPRDGLPGLRLPLTDIAGHHVTPANDFARIFDAEADGKEKQFDLVVFLDGVEKEGRVVERDETDFRTSWRRPKWHVFTQ